MGNTFKPLGQANPTAGVLTTLYTAPAATSTTISSITICNQSSLDDKIRLSVAVAGATDTTKQYIYYDLVVAANDTFIATIGITLAATDVVRCQSLLGNTSFNAFGVEMS